MPELPEVETTRRGIAPHILDRKVEDVVVRNASLRWPISPELTTLLPGSTVSAVRRRGKYLLFTTEAGTLIVHLGMSGSLRMVNPGDAAGKHDHVDLSLEGGLVLRYHDPRRFGCMLWTVEDPRRHELLSHLGPEPLEPGFDTDYLYRLSRGRKAAVKTFIMDSRVVVGVGNIYANEALYLAGIRPDRAAGRISRARYERLVETIREVLSAAVKQGGTTLRDFVGGDGQPGYFRQQLNVYDHGGEPCPGCGRELREIRLGQRSTIFCGHCQT